MSGEATWLVTDMQTGVQQETPSNSRVSPQDFMRGPVDHDAIMKRLGDECPVWEEQFAAGPGYVIGLPDAATVCLRIINELRLNGGNESGDDG